MFKNSKKTEGAPVDQDKAGRSRRRLVLNKETVRSLSDSELRQVAGGVSIYGEWCGPHGARESGFFTCGPH